MVLRNHLRQLGYLDVQLCPRALNSETRGFLSPTCAGFSLNELIHFVSTTSLTAMSVTVVTLLLLVTKTEQRWTSFPVAEVSPSIVEGGVRRQTALLHVDDH